jgi:hypothetical protein
MSRLRIPAAATLALLVVAAGSIAATVTLHGGASNKPSVVSTATHPNCPARAGSGTCDSTVSPMSGAPGSTVTISGALPVIAENGANVGQTSNEVDVYWNLDFEKWWSVLGTSPSPAASIQGSPVKLIGKQDVAKLCEYQVQVTIPSVLPGEYPIEVLYQSPDKGGPSFASFAPTNFRVTSG